MANFNEVMDMNARSMPKRGAEKKPEVRSIEHERSENGGHVFKHNFENHGAGYKEPEMHTFGKSEGREALEHFAKHAGLSEHMTREEEPGEPEGDIDSAAGAAT